MDVLFVNESEALALAGLPSAVHAASVLSRTASVVIVTRGARSVLVAQDGHVVFEQPVPAVEVIDTTGAGDCFAGTFVARRLSGAGLREAVRAAGIAASLCIGRPGASPSMPWRSEVDALLDLEPESARDRARGAT